MWWVQQLTAWLTVLMAARLAGGSVGSGDRCRLLSIAETPLRLLVHVGNGTSKGALLTARVRSNLLKVRSPKQAHRERVRALKLLLLLMLCAQWYLVSVSASEVQRITAPTETNHQSLVSPVVRRSLWCTMEDTLWKKGSKQMC